MEKAHEPDERLAERYFLGELSDDDAEAYEAHYFDCARCAEYVAEELAMMESGRAVAMAQRSEIAPVADFAAARKRKREWLPLAAAAALVITVGTPQLLRPVPQPPPSMTTLVNIPELMFSANRSETAALPSFKPDTPIPLTVTVPSVDAPRVELSVRNAATKATVVQPERLTEEKLRSSFLMVLSPLPAGTYDVVIEGVREDGNRSTIAFQQFEVRR
jgi:anti-sigma factor RsiW